MRKFFATLLFLTLLVGTQTISASDCDDDSAEQTSEETLARPLHPNIVLGGHPYKTELYVRTGCSYCDVAKREVTDLKLLEDSQNLTIVAVKNNTIREKLRKRGGKTQVPCLFVQMEQNGPWLVLYESKDIVKWLKINQTFYQKGGAAPAKPKHKCKSCG